MLETFDSTPPEIRGRRSLVAPLQINKGGRRRFTLCLAHGARVPESELANYSFHSFRIFLACALLANDCPRWLIKRMLRWRGDESLEIYARVSDQQWELRLNGVLDAVVESSQVARLPPLDVTPEREGDLLAMAHAFLGVGLADIN